MTPLKFMIIGTVYTAMLLGANPVFADLSKLVPDTLVNFRVHAEPVEVSKKQFLDVDGSLIDLSTFTGKTVVLNFWATWCAPCRAEMPSLDALQDTLGGDKFQVVTVAAGRNPPEMIDRFFEKTEISLLPKYRDPKMEFALSMDVRGLPVTVIINPDGKEVARISGEADWATPEMIELLSSIE